VSTPETQAEAKTPAIPDELWMLALDDGSWAVPVDDLPGGENYLVCLSEADAIAAAQHQEAVYDIICRPVRVK